MYGSDGRQNAKAVTLPSGEHLHLGWDSAIKTRQLADSHRPDHCRLWQTKASESIAGRDEHPCLSGKSPTAVPPALLLSDIVCITWKPTP